MDRYEVTNRELVHECSQLWKHLKINIAQAYEPSEDLDALAKDFVQFHQYGATVNESQNYQIPTSFVNILQKLELVLEDHLKSGVEELTWSNFWINSKKCPGLSHNWRTVFDAIKDKVVPFSDFSGVLMGTQCKKTPEDFLIKHEDKFLKLMMTCRNGAVKTTPTGCSKQFGFLIHFLRMTCNDRKALPDFIGLMSSRSGQVVAMKTSNEMLDHVHDFNWLITNLILPCKLVGEKYNLVILAERYMIETGRKLFDLNAKEGDPFFNDHLEHTSLIEECRVSGDYSDLVDLKPEAFVKLLEVEKVIKAPGTKTYDQILTLVTLDNMRASTLSFKLAYVAQWALLRGAMDALKKWGAYPILKIKVMQDELEVNWALREYLRTR